MNYLRRKKLAFMNIVNKVKGFVRMVSGIPPLTLQKCVDEQSLIDYKIYGDSLQEGTPSPENPVEIKTVGDKTTNEYEPYGKYKIPITAKTKNMIKPIDGVYGYNSSITVEDGKMTVHNLEQSAGGSSWHVCEVPCEFSKGEIGKSYIASWGGSIVSAVGRSNMRITFEDGSDKTLWGNWANVKFTLTSPIKDVRFILSKLDDAIQMETPIVVQIEEGTEVTDYEPYQEPITTNIYLDEPLGSGDSISYKEDNLPQLPTFKGTTIYEVDTEVQPSNMEVTYYGSQKGE